MTEKYRTAPVSEEFFTEDTFGDTVFCDVSEEFSLPEYEPEIKKILRVSARVLPAGKYVGSGRAEFAGTVAYGLIYMGAENEIACVDLSSDYEFAVPCSGGEPAVYADTRADSVLCRPLGPRRLQFRTKLKSRVQMLSKAALPVCEAPKDACVLRTASTACRRMRVSGGEFAISGEMKLKGKPLACDHLSGQYLLPCVWQAFLGKGPVLWCENSSACECPPPRVDWFPSPGLGQG